MQIVNICKFGDIPVVGSWLGWGKANQRMGLLSLYDITI